MLTRRTHNPSSRSLLTQVLFSRRAWLGASLGACAALTGSRIQGAAATDAEWEITAAGEDSLARGLDWLARNQGPQGNWGSDNLGLVGLGALAFLADGHTPGRGKYGEVVERALEFLLKNAKPSGLLNIAGDKRDMYNHGLACFVLGQAHGMVNDQRISPTLDRALKLIANTQCDDGGWEYEARRKPKGHDLSLVVMQAKALRSAVDSGLEVPPEVIEAAIRNVRRHYVPTGGGDLSRMSEQSQRSLPGQFTYAGGGGGTLAMAACGVVCLQEFGQYDDWRIEKNMDLIGKEIEKIKSFRPPRESPQLPLDAYTLYYVGQAIYQVGGEWWRKLYPLLRDSVIAGQGNPSDVVRAGMWTEGPRGRVGGKEGQLYATSVACFVLAMPNRYLPILQEGRIEGLRNRFVAP